MLTECTQNELTINQRLLNAGLGHRRTVNSINTGKHEIYELETGKVLGKFTAAEACELLSTKGL